MKILILQLSKLDSCIQTYSLLEGLLETYEPNTVDLLVRQKNAALLEALPLETGQLISLEDLSILDPIASSGNRRESLLRLKRMLGALKAQSYDKVINLSFTPLSSYIANELESVGADVSGYNRSSDGFFKLNGDASAYYFAQCGASAANRAHRCEIWSNICGFDSEILSHKPCKSVERQGLVLSFDGKNQFSTFEAHKWTNIARTLLREQEGEILLLGSSTSREVRESIRLLLNDDRIVNLPDDLDLHQREQLLRQSRLVITCAGYMVQLADRSHTPTLAVYTQQDSFWEEGPRTPTSRVLASESLNGIASDQVCKTIHRMLTKTVGECGSDEFVMQKGVPSFQNGQDPGFAWRLCEAIYLDHEWPALETESQLEAFAKLYELNQITFEQLEKFESNQGQDINIATQVLDRVDELIESVGRLESSLAPLINWFRTEKIRIEPGEVQQLVRDTRSVHDMMNGVVIGYLARYDIISAADMEVRNEDGSMEQG